MGEFIGLMARIHVLAAEGAEGHGIADPSISHAVWTWVIFALVFLVLWKWAWKPMREQLEARENRIRDTVEKARELKEEAEALLEKHREQMDRAKADAQEIVNQGREAAERVQREAAEAGQLEAREIIDRAKREIDLETKKAIHEIRREAVDLTLAAASQVLSRSLEDDDHRRLTSEVIEELDRLPAEG
jgi:F-type H+-transporting ATPase subunit b